MKKLIALMATAVLLAAFSISTVGKKLPSVVYVLVGPKKDGGWSMRHYQGFKSLEKHGYKVSGVEMVPEAESTKVFPNLHENMILYLQPHSVIWMEWRNQQRNLQIQFSCMPQVTRVMIQIWTTTFVIHFKHDILQELQLEC